jgi:hypothetical protein
MSQRLSDFLSFCNSKVKTLVKSAMKPFSPCLAPRLHCTLTEDSEKNLKEVKK